MTKILHIIIGLNIGGAERALYRLIEAHRNNPNYRHIVISLTTTGKIGEKLIDCGIEVISLGMASFLSSPLFFLKLITAIKERQPDLVHTWMYHADLMGGIAAWLLRKKVIWSVRNSDVAVGSGTASMTYYIMRACALLSKNIPHVILCVANASVSSHSRYGYHKEKMLFIPNGYDLERLTNEARLSDICSDSIGVNKSSIKIVSVGRYNDYKDFPTFIGAASILLNNNSNLDLQFVLIGRGLNRKNIDLCTLIDSTIKPNCFLLLDERNDVPALLNMMDIFCLHSASEGFPNVLGEAMSLGIPCVTTDVGDAALIMGYEQKDFIVPTKNPDALAQALQRLIDFPHKQRQDLGGALRLRIQQHFSLQSTVQAYEQVYQDVISK